jgi:hypothetical protein
LAAASSASGVSHLLRQLEWTPPPEYKAVASIVKAEDDPEEFPGLRQAQLESFVAMDEFSEVWIVAYHRRAEEERRRRLSLVINLDNDDDVGQSNRPRKRRLDADQGCIYLPQTKEDPNNEEEDYAAAMNRHLGLGRGGNSGGY